MAIRNRYSSSAPSFLEVQLLLVLGDFVERRLGDVEVALRDELGHLPVEERQEQRADVAPVHVGVRHDDDVVVADLVRVVVLSSPMPVPERGDEGDNFLRW